MRWSEILTEVGASLKFNRRRTLLTVLSLGWGLACFVILMSYGDGFARAMADSFKAVGQDLILTFGGQTSLQAGGMRSGRRIPIELTDLTPSATRSRWSGRCRPKPFAAA